MSRLVLLCAALLIFIVITSELFPQAEGVEVAKKRDKSRSRSSSSSSSRSSSGKKPSFIQRAKEKVKNTFTRKKNKPVNKNPQSSYPKQQYKPTSTNTGTNYGTNTGYNPYNQKTNYGTNTRYNQKTHYGSSHPNYYNYAQNYGRTGHGRTSIFKKKKLSHKLFGSNKLGKKTKFGLAAGAGFLGGAAAGVAGMEVYHRYKQYKAMMHYKTHSNYYGHYQSPGYSGTGLYYQNNYDCFGGCPIGAFCDFGMCRCRSGYEERYGRCWNRASDFDRRDWSRRRSASFNAENEACSEHSTCLDIDMNLYCSNERGRCSCREDMRWNKEDLECQIYMDVDCSEFERSGYRYKRDTSDENSTETETTKAPSTGSSETSVQPNTNTNTDETTNIPDTNTINSTNKEVQTAEDLGVKLPEYNFTENFNITDLKPEDTLRGSELTKINVKDTSPKDIRHTFCKEIKAVQLQYERPRQQRVTYELPGWAAGIIVTVVLLCCCCCCCCACYNSIKEKIERITNPKPQDVIMAGGAAVALHAMESDDEDEKEGPIVGVPTPGDQNADGIPDHLQQPPMMGQPPMMTQPVPGYPTPGDMNADGIPDYLQQPQPMQPPMAGYPTPGDRNADGIPDHLQQPSYPPAPYPGAAPPVAPVPGYPTPGDLNADGIPDHLQQPSYPPAPYPPM